MPKSTVIQKAVNTECGRCLWPSQTSKNDQKYNFRADKGSDLPGGKVELIIQANKNAENKGVRENVQQDSHRIVAKVVVDPTNDPSGSSVEDDALNSFEKKN
ncbi:hypothetical protein M501DRAFT_1004562 [Patellaria atrata CBS 101060]|uniref:Uncharacterized protein n=1 Tax=Patellaria atrata CBS 101060 TaxID=1346257 RepID=A0A9P4SBI8_9PEZI|nr:hypothetical protein M501DRAFT_1004562 [Patellaria atrata CBS 101060]